MVQVGGLGGSLLQEVEAADRPDGQLRRRPQELRRLPGNRLVPMLQNFFDRNLRIFVINIALPKVVCLFKLVLHLRVCPKSSNPSMPQSKV